MAVPLHRRLATGFLQQRPEFVPGAVKVGFVVDKEALGLTFIRLSLFSSCQYNSAAPYLFVRHLEDEQRPVTSRSSTSAWYRLIVSVNKCTFNLGNG